MAGNDEGAILVFFAVAVAILLGIVALSFDLGQKAATQTELQSFADQVALAAAGELDGNSDAITRADAAAANLITDTQTFATGEKNLAGVDDYALTYFSTLPSADATDLTSGSTTNPVLAAYVRVVATPRDVPWVFGNVLALAAGTAPANPAIGAVAVAGYTLYACDITPLMFCIPSPSFDADTSIGKMIHLRMGGGGNGAAWAPGDFGFLDLGDVIGTGPCAGLGNAPKTRCLIGSTNGIGACFAQRGVDVKPGQSVGLENSAFNVRFDLYDMNMNSKQNNPDYAPAPNVIKGQEPKNNNGCVLQASTTSAALPRDTCFNASGLCNGSRFGDGVWSKTNYVQKNYGGTDPFPSVTTRYQYYRSEIDAHGGAGSTARILSLPRKETGRRQCSNQQSTDYDRRVVVAAGIDCSANPIQGSADGVPVKEFVRLFMTEPIGGSGNNFDLYVEVVGSASATTTGGLFHDVVQLYR